MKKKDTTDTTVSHKEVAARGGRTTLAKYGKKHFSEMGKKGVATKLKKYGPLYFSRIRQIALEKKRKQKKAVETEES